MKTGQAAIVICQRPPDNFFDLVFVKLVQDQNPRPRQQRTDYFERGILSRCPDKDHGAVLDRWEERVLLCLIEAMDLVDEENGSMAALAVKTCFGNRAAQIFDSRENGRERNEPRVRLVRQQPR